MDYKEQSEQSNATVIKPRQANSPKSAISDKNAKLQTEPSLDTDQARSLTRINLSLKTTDNSVGFKNARKEANQALATNKIILNNRFVLESIIGSGGMGTVYKAQDLRKVEANDIKPFIAVKVLNEAFQNHPDAFVTLQREASKSSILAHPHIVTVHDFDRDGDIIYMTMELLEGTDLESYIKQNKDNGVDPEIALKIINDYCKAIIYAHANNIIHSDLKPGNIYLTKNSTKVLDFGIARLSNKAQGQDSFDAGSLGALTPAYASLEMINNEPPDQSDDVYASAVIAYEILSGKHPYQRKSAAEALQAKLKPARLNKLNKRQWHALESGLQLKREARTPTLEIFLKQLTKARKHIFLKVSSLVFVTISVVVTYFQFIDTNNISVVINKTLTTGTACFKNNDFLCALESANSILKLDPQNSSAKELYEKSTKLNTQFMEKKYFSLASKCIEKNDLDCAHSNLASLKIVAPQSTTIKTLSTTISLKIIQGRVESCLTERNYSCVIENSKLMLQKDKNNSFALISTIQAQEILSQNQQKIANRRTKYNSNIIKAESCYEKRNYDCSMKYSKQALLYKPNNVKATTLYQKSLFKKNQFQESMKKAKNILNQGDICFDQKNYNCAIAKSESALEFVPGYIKAIKLKEDAKHEVEKLKNSIVIE